MKTEVYCKLSVEGVHKWKGAPIEVSYLRNEHRHMFIVKAWKGVGHEDRDVEFISMKHSIQDYLTTKYYNANKKLLDFHGASCEMIASELVRFFDLTKCDVSEDGENGSIVYSSKNN